MKSRDADPLKTRTTLLSKVRRDEEEGWDRFYKLYQRFVYAAARGAALSHEEAEDVVQETMITVRNHVRQFVPNPERAQFRTWLRTIVRSRIADQYRRRKRNPLEHAARPAQDPEETGTSITNQIPNFSEVELDRIIDGNLQKAILAEARRTVRKQVQAEHYQAYDLFVIQELSAREVGSSLGISPVTVRVRAVRVRRVVEREVRRIARALEQGTKPHLA